jgi:hypothetical protein
MESLSRLTSLTSLRMGPNPEDVCQHSSPLGFPRLPAFLAGLGRLQCLDISMADAPSAAPLSSVCFEPLRAIPDVKLTLRADTSLRSVAHLPPSLSAVTGLSSLTVQVCVRLCVRRVCLVAVAWRAFVVERLLGAFFARHEHTPRTHPPATHRASPLRTPAAGARTRCSTWRRSRGAGGCASWT